MLNKRACFTANSQYKHLHREKHRLVHHSSKLAFIQCFVDAAGLVAEAPYIDYVFAWTAASIHVLILVFIFVVRNILTVIFVLIGRRVTAR